MAFPDASPSSNMPFAPNAVETKTQPALLCRTVFTTTKELQAIELHPKTWCLAPKKHVAWHQNHPKNDQNSVPGTEKHPKTPISRGKAGRVFGCLAPSWKELVGAWHRVRALSSSDAQSRGKALPSPRVPTTRDDNWAELELLAAPDQIVLNRSHSNRPDPASSTAADHFPSTR